MMMPESWTVGCRSSFSGGAGSVGPAKAKRKEKSRQTTRKCVTEDLTGSRSGKSQVWSSSWSLVESYHNEAHFDIGISHFPGNKSGQGTQNLAQPGRTGGVHDARDQMSSWFFSLVLKN